MREARASAVREARGGSERGEGGEREARGGSERGEGWR